MAKVVEEFPETLGKRGGRGTSYNYDEWFDGQKWALTKGEDFDAKTTSMVSGIKNQLEQRGLVATVGASGDTVYVQVTGKMDDEQKAKVAEKRKRAADKLKAKAESNGSTKAPAKKTATKKTAAKK